MDTPRATRAEVASGLRKLADIIETTEVPAMDGWNPRLTVGVWASHDRDEALAEAAAVARAFPQVEKESAGDRFQLRAVLDGVRVVYSWPHETLCEKRVVTKQVEEWVCPPSLLELAAAVDEAAG